jgi:hypothetical protein
MVWPGLDLITDIGQETQGAADLIDTHRQKGCILDRDLHFFDWRGQMIAVRV